jgi:myo-inositol 2-dehydrogenase / D-chiro-inositol 1-dehydrogenase
MAVKVGFVGSGGIARHHLKIIANMKKEADIVAICDPMEERVRDAINNYGGKPYLDYRKMFDEIDMDAVYICVPPYAHGDIELEAASRKIAMFIEKPVSNNLKTAEEIESDIKRYRVLCSVGYHWRYMSSTDEAKKMLKNKKISMVLGYWVGGFPGVEWWRQRARSGGQHVEQTTHIFDLARYFAGDVTSVYAVANAGLMKEHAHYDIDDTSVVALKFKNGVIGSISSGCIVPQGLKVGLTLVGKNLVLKGDSGGFTVSTPEKQEDIRAKNDAYKLEDEVFIKAVKTKNSKLIRSTYSDAVKTLKVTLAATESIKTGKKILI